MLNSGLWNRPYSIPEAAHINAVDQRDNHHMWRLFFHGERWAESMSHFVAVDHVIDLDVVPDPGSLSPITFFCSKIRTAAGVSLPPVYMQGDNIIGDSIDRFLAQDQGSTVADPYRGPRGFGVI